MESERLTLPDRMAMTGWLYSSRGCVAPASLRKGVAYSPLITSFKIGDFDHDGAGDFLSYLWYFQNGIRFGNVFAPTQRGSASWVFSRHEMR